MKSYGLFYFWRMYELFHRFYRYKFVGEIHLDKSRLRSCCFRTMYGNGAGMKEILCILRLAGHPSNVSFSDAVNNSVFPFFTDDFNDVKGFCSFLGNASVYIFLTAFHWLSFIFASSIQFPPIILVYLFSLYNTSMYSNCTVNTRKQKIGFEIFTKTPHLILCGVL